MTPTLASPDKATIRKFFDGIAPRYDRINTLLSLRLDESWRRKAVELVLDGMGNSGGAILDLGVGTGKFLEAFLERKKWQRAAGVDFSGEMLRLAQRELPSTCELIQADIHDLPFEGESFDLIVSSFTLRSVKERPRFFAGLHRILKRGGRVALLCLTRPTSFWMRALYAPYLKIYLPWVGGAISTDREAYRFLSESIQAFPAPEEIGKELETCRFRAVRFSPFTFGISTLIQAEK